MAKRETWVVLGATSSMARAFIRLVAAEGADTILAGRDTEDMGRTAADIRARFSVDAEVVAFDAREVATHQSLAEIAAAREGVVNVAVFLGSMPAQGEVDAKPNLTAALVADNFGGAASALHYIAPALEARGTGIVIGVGSVAGDRPRLKNYVYGSTKAGFHAYLSGLRYRLRRKGVHVVTVKPGFIDTAMTWGDERLPFTSAPDAAAADMLHAARQGRDTVYTPWYWRWVMLLVRAMPERVFIRLSF